MSPSARRPRRGFTLVELLVVVGIIGLLIAMLLPALRKAKDQAVRTECASNLRQWGQALTMYAAQHKGYFPNNWNGQHLSWISVEMRDFLQGFMMPLMQRDASLGAPHITFCPTQEWHRFYRENNPPGPNDIELIGYFYLPHRNPASCDYTPAGVEWAAKKKFGGEARHAPIMSDMMQSISDVTWGGSGQPFSNHCKPNSNIPTGSNFLFEDGRVEWYDYRPRRQGNPASIEVGANVGGWLCWYKIPIPKQN